MDNFNNRERRYSQEYSPPQHQYQKALNEYNPFIQHQRYHSPVLSGYKPVYASQIPVQTQQNMVPHNVFNSNIDHSKQDEHISNQQERIKQIEDQIEILSKNFQRQSRTVKHKNQELDQWKTRYNNIQDQLVLNIQRVRQLELTVDDMRVEQQKLLYTYETKNSEFKHLNQLYQDRNQEAEYHRSNIENIETAKMNILDLEYKVRQLEQEVVFNNNRNIRYSPSRLQQVTYPVVQSPSRLQQMIYQVPVQEHLPQVSHRLQTPPQYKDYHQVYDQNLFPAQQNNNQKSSQQYFPK